MAAPLTTVEFAHIAGISFRKARRALARALAGKPWRDAYLDVQTVLGRGGERGVSYLVRAASLPPELQEALRARLAPVEQHSIGFAENGAAERAWWSGQLRSLRDLPPGRPLAAAVKKLAAQDNLTDWAGKPISLTERTIYRRLAALKRDGEAGLKKRARRDKGKQRVFISQSWDGAVSLDQDTKNAIAKKLKTYIRRLYRGRCSPKVISDNLAPAELKRLTAKHCDTKDMPDSTFQVSRRFINPEREEVSPLALFEGDRKTYEDTKPRILRTIEGLEPMEIVVGDVHHIDILMRRPDGTEAWPKAIAWLDFATRRVWLDVVLPDKGKSISNADVIMSFIRMVTACGMPSALYLDNGSEYRWAEFIDDALKLVSINNERSSQIIRAKTRNAPAKPIENTFNILERTYFRHIPGWGRRRPHQQEDGQSKRFSRPLSERYR